MLLRRQPGLALLLALGSSGLAAADRNWSAYLGDTGGTHYSTLTQVTTANVARLQPAWTYHAGGADPKNRSQIQCNPLVIDGVLYGTSPALALFALDAASGRELWRFTPEVDASGRGPVGLNRGLAWWHEGDERRLLFSAGKFLHAIDPATGKPMESFGDHGRVDLLDGLDRDTKGLYLAANTPGAIYRDLIVIGMRLGEGPATAAPGHIRAYDVRTGRRRWIFHTIPFPGEAGQETWSADSWKTSGAANNWAGMVVDPERGLVFVPTGSATFDFWGGDRVGENLYANCLLALDAATGQRRWHFQFTHHDVWDRDLPAAPVLCEVTRAGKNIAAVAQVTKSGHVWVFDRETGESLFPWKEEPVPASILQGERTSPTQPVPQKPAPFARQRFTAEEVTERTPAAHEAVLKRLRELNPHRPFDPPSERGTIVLPGFDGGAEWGGPAVDPRGVLYVNANEMAWVLQMVPTALFGAGPKAIYAQFCMACHGLNREGNAAANIPNLTTVGTRLKAADIVTLLGSGKGVMPSFSFLPGAAKESLARLLVSPETEEAATARESGAPAPGSTVASPYVTTGYNKFLDPAGYPALRPPWGTLSAIDLNAGTIRWKIPFGEFPELAAKGLTNTGSDNYGGPVVTAGGLLFIGATNFDRKFHAYDKLTGKLLWETTLPFAGNATPSTYTVNGKQYIAIACGGGKNGAPSGSTIVAFALP